jgi:hypothetical protein
MTDRIALQIAALRFRPSQGTEISFPLTIKTTPCATRTFSIVLPMDSRYKSTRHGAIKIVQSFTNRPTITAPRIGLPGFYTKWADGE